jgi:glyoxylate utilization-related uncharacterized protein
MLCCSEKNNPLAGFEPGSSDPQADVHCAEESFLMCECKDSKSLNDQMKQGLKASNFRTFHCIQKFAGIGTGVQK